MRWMIGAMVFVVVIAGCGTRTSLVEGLGDAENAVFSEDGRLFVSGGQNVFEVLLANGKHVPRALYAETCNSTGLAIRSGFLYAACVAGEVGQAPAYLLAAELRPEPVLAIIHEFAPGTTPNGMAFGPDGRLFVADSTPLAGKIIALALDPGSALAVSEEKVWRSGFTFLNGLRYFDDALYVTDLNSLARIAIEPDGSAGVTRTLATELTVFDDLLANERGIAVTDFLGGRISFYSLEGRRLARTDALFDSPSSVIAGRAPLAPSDSLVVTEKGAIGELDSDDGNRVSIFMPAQAL